MVSRNIEPATAPNPKVLKMMLHHSVKILAKENLFVKKKKQSA